MIHYSFIQDVKILIKYFVRCKQIPIWLWMPYYKWDAPGRTAGINMLDFERRTMTINDKCVSGGMHLDVSYRYSLCGFLQVIFK